MKGIIWRALQTGQTLEMIYISRNNKITHRYIKIVKIGSHSILAFCFEKRKLRTFKLDNILSIAPTKKRRGARMAM